MFDALDPDFITGTVDVPIVTDPDGTPNRVLPLNAAWDVEVNWHLDSSDPVLHPVTSYGGEWRVRLGIESLGPGIEQFIADDVKALVDREPGFTPASCAWKILFNIPAATVPDEGIYKLVTLITYKDDAGLIEAMAGFQENPLVTFYQAA